MSEYGIVTAPPSTGGSDTDNSGYKFTVGSGDIKVSGLRCYLPSAVSKTLYLWDCETKAALGSVAVSAATATWTEGLFASPILLTARKSYIVSAYTDGYYKCALSSTILNSKISLVGGAYGGGAASFPTSVSSSNIYGLIDIILYTPSYKSSGHAVYTVPDITGDIASSMIAWTEDKPAGTSVAVSVGTDGSGYSAVTNGGQLLPPGSYDNATAYIKVELATTDATLTPTVSGLHFTLQTVEDTYSIILEMEPLQRFESAAGDITVAYDGAGTLQGAGGPVAAFSRTFAPTELVAKPHQNDAEHISIASVAAAGTLTHIYYRDCTALEHISIAGITAVGTLTNVKDI